MNKVITATGEQRHATIVRHQQAIIGCTAMIQQ
ncbi:Uncharacterised protein [Vibrio cholerae]|nr:Uncharacterised protein [Vibrio cholerae]